MIPMVHIENTTKRKDMVPNQNSSIVPNQTTHHRKLPSSQGSHVRSLAQEEAPKNIVEKFFGFHDSFSVYGFHVVGASPHAVRTVCNLCSIRLSWIRQVAFPKSFSCLRIKGKGRWDVPPRFLAGRSYRASHLLRTWPLICQISFPDAQEPQPQTLDVSLASPSHEYPSI